ncbi:MAG: Gldg family protein [Chitinophagaceae bacterium]|nr:Gldg family protein [Chitinophagaceae bacterium]
MKIIYKIARNEFRYLFYSPVAWFVMIVFLIECAVFYTQPLYDKANWQDILIKNNPKFKGQGALTYKIFIDAGVFQNVISNLYLFVPVLTMGLISREVNNGSSKLLYSSPVRLRQIVLGKYFGITLFNLLLVAILGIFMTAACINIKHVDYGLLLSAAVGFYLLVCAYSAIGLFMSSLSTYQVVSALSTFTIIFVLSRIGGLWQRYDFVRDLTYFLSLQDRVIKMLGGLIVSRDVIYFMVVAALFVSFTLIKLRGGKEKKPWYVQPGRYMTVMAAALLVGYITSRPKLTGYLDTTAMQYNTVPKEMQKIISDFGDSTLEVTLYTNLLGQGLDHGLPEARNADYMGVMWDPYLRFKPGIVFKYEYYYDIDTQAPGNMFDKMFSDKALSKIAQENADRIDASLSMFRSPEEMRRIIDLQPEGCRLVMQLKYRGRTTFLRTYDDPVFWPDITNVATAFRRLQDPQKIPRICFVSGELERSIYKTGGREYSFHTAAKTGRGALVNIGFDVDTINLATQDIPSGVTALVLADPKTDLSPAVQHKLKSYIDAGGNMIISGKPGKQYVLNPLLKRLGVQLLDGQLVQPSYDETPDKVISYAIVKEDTATVLMPGVTGIDYKEAGPAFTAKPLLMTIPGSTWLKAGQLLVDSTLPPFNPAAGDYKESSFSTALQLTRQINNKEQRIILCGDADFASNFRLARNLFFITPMYSWVDYDDYPGHMTYIEPKDGWLRLGAEGADTQKVVFIWIIPGLVLLSGVILLIRRKRK